MFTGGSNSLPSFPSHPVLFSTYYCGSTSFTNITSPIQCQHHLCIPLVPSPSCHSLTPPLPTPPPTCFSLNYSYPPFHFLHCLPNCPSHFRILKPNSNLCLDAIPLNLKQ